MPYSYERPPSSIYTDGREVLYDGNDGNKYFNLKMQPGEKARFIVFVKNLLIKKNMTIVDLAEACNLPVSTTYKLLCMSDGQFRGKAAARVANYLKVSRGDWYCQVVTEEDRRKGHQGIHIEATKKYKKKKRAQQRAKELEEKRRNASFDSCML